MRFLLRAPSGSGYWRTRRAFVRPFFVRASYRRSARRSAGVALQETHTTTGKFEQVAYASPCRGATGTFTHEIAFAAYQLPLAQDAADRLIAATAIVLDLTLLTADEKLLELPV